MESQLPSIARPSREGTASVNFTTPLHQSNFIYASVHKKRVKPLVDTGSSISCLSNSLLKWLDMPVVQMRPSNIKNIISVGGEKLAVVAQCSLPNSE